MLGLTCCKLQKVKNFNGVSSSSNFYVTILLELSGKSLWFDNSSQFGAVCESLRDVYVLIDVALMICANCEFENGFCISGCSFTSIQTPSGACCLRTEAEPSL